MAKISSVQPIRQFVLHDWASQEEYDVRSRIFSHCLRSVIAS